MARARRHGPLPHPSRQRRPLSSASRSLIALPRPMILLRFAAGFVASALCCILPARSLGQDSIPAVHARICALPAHGRRARLADGSPQCGTDDCRRRRSRRRADPFRAIGYRASTEPSLRFRSRAAIRCRSRCFSPGMASVDTVAESVAVRQAGYPVRCSRWPRSLPSPTAPPRPGSSGRTPAAGRSRWPHGPTPACGRGRSGCREPAGSPAPSARRGCTTVR